MVKGYKWDVDKTLPIGPGKGCIYAPLCEKCPFEDFDGVCLYHLTGLFKAKILKENRDEIIYKGFIAGRDVGDIAKVFKLSKSRTRAIIVKEYKKE